MFRFSDNNCVKVFVSIPNTFRLYKTDGLQVRVHKIFIYYSSFSSTIKKGFRSLWVRKCNLSVHMIGPTWRNQKLASWNGDSVSQASVVLDGIVWSNCFLIIHYIRAFSLFSPIVFKIIFFWRRVFSSMNLKLFFWKNATALKYMNININWCCQGLIFGN